MSWASIEPEGRELLPASKGRWGLMGNPIRVGLCKIRKKQWGNTQAFYQPTPSPPACIQLSNHVPPEVAEHLRLGSHLIRGP